MRGQDQSSSSRFGYKHADSPGVTKHPLRLSREMLGLLPQVVDSPCQTGFCGPLGRRRGTTL